jgi:hypothetical protein
MAATGAGADTGTAGATTSDCCNIGSAPGAAAAAAAEINSSGGGSGARFAVSCQSAAQLKLAVSEAVANNSGNSKSFFMFLLAGCNVLINVCGCG